MTDQFLIISCLASLLIGIGAAFLFAFGLIKVQSWWLRALIASFVYALFLGFGVLGSGGDPGFALPAPVIPTFIFSDENVRFSSAVIPFFCWWTLFFAIQVVKRLYKMMIQTKKF
jgi:hypothetical protein